MTHTCLPDERLAELLDRPGADPLRREAERCARCRSRLRAFREFLQPSGVPAGADPDDAERRLAGILDSELPGSAGRPAATPGAMGRARSSVHPARGPAPGGGHRRAWSLGRLWAPAFRPAWGVAILLVAVWGIRSAGLLESRGGEEITLRQGSGDSGSSLVTDNPVLESDGSRRLRWRSVAGADRYEIVLHDAAFAERLRSDARTETSLVVPAGAIASLLPADGGLFWRVVAYRGGDVVAQSEIAPLVPVPAR